MGSQDSEPHPRDMLKEELPKTLPILFAKLGIDFGNLRLIEQDGEINVVFEYTDKSNSSEWVIRVQIEEADPEDDENRRPTPHDQAAILYFLENYSAKFVSLPKVTHVDSTNDNPTTRPYMIESKIPGQRLEELLADLSTDQKTSVVRQVIALLFAMESTPLPGTGTCCADPKNKKKLLIGPFRDLFITVKNQPTGDVTIEEWLLSLLGSRLNEIEKGMPDKIRKDFLRLFDIMQEMEEIGFFKDANDHRMNQGFLYHPDLHVGNIMAQRSDTGEVQFTGVIDWDNAEARPLILGRKPPYWLWTPERVFENEEITVQWNYDADHLPSQYWDLMTEDQRETKKIFDELVAARSATYMDDAYGRGFWIRRISQFACWGSSGYQEMAMLECFVKEWKEYLGMVRLKQSKAS